MKALEKKKDYPMVSQVFKKSGPYIHSGLKENRGNNKSCVCRCKLSEACLAVDNELSYKVLESFDETTT